MQAIVAGNDVSKREPAGGAGKSGTTACGRDCEACPKKLSCPFSPFAKNEGGRA